MRRWMWLFILVAWAWGTEPGLAQPPVAPRGEEDFAEHPDDAALRARVEAELKGDRRLHWEVLNVKVRNGRVDLFGKVRTQEEQALATTVTSTVPGVKAVNNHVLALSSLPEKRAPEGRKGAEDIHGPTPF